MFHFSFDFCRAMSRSKVIKYCKLAVDTLDLTLQRWVTWWFFFFACWSDAGQQFVSALQFMAIFSDKCGVTAKIQQHIRNKKVVRLKNRRGRAGQEECYVLPSPLQSTLSCSIFWTFRLRVSNWCEMTPLWNSGKDTLVFFWPALLPT